MVYASESIALAALEAFVHFDTGFIPKGLVLVALDVPEGVRVAKLPENPALPRDWRAYPAPESLNLLGDQWVETGKTALLRVPSAIIPESFNYLINPGHADARIISATIERPYLFDVRMGG